MSLPLAAAHVCRPFLEEPQRQQQQHTPLGSHVAALNPGSSPTVADLLDQAGPASAMQGRQEGAGGVACRLLPVCRRLCEQGSRRLAPTLGFVRLSDIVRDESRAVFV